MFTTTLSKKTFLRFAFSTLIKSTIYIHFTIESFIGESWRPRRIGSSGQEALGHLGLPVAVGSTDEPIAINF